MATIVSAVVGFLKVVGGVAGATGTAAAVQGALTVASLAYSVASGINQYRAGKKQAGKAEDLREAQRDAVSNYRDPIEPRRIVYGEVRLGGPIVYAEEAGGGPTVHLVIPLASHEVEEIGDVYVNDEVLTLNASGHALGKYHGVLYVKKYPNGGGSAMRTSMQASYGPINGVNTTGVDNLLLSDRWDGMACLYVRIFRWAKKFQESPNFSAIVKGKKVYDPRTGLMAWSRNNALCAADYLANYVPKQPQVIEADLIEAANICEEPVPLKAGGTEERYTCNGVIISTQSHDSVLGMFEDSMAGRIVYSSGSWRIMAGSPVTPNPETFSNNDFAGDYSYSYNTATRSLPNVVRGHFLDPDQEGEPIAYPSRKHSSWTAGDEIPLDLDLPLTRSHTMAQRIAEIYLRRARLQRKLEAPVRPRWLTARPGDVVTVDCEEIGNGPELWDVADFGTSLANDIEGGVTGIVLASRVVLQEYSDSVYDWDETTDELDLDSASTNLGGVSTTTPTDVEIAETDLVTSPNFTANYPFTWVDPDNKPSADLDHLEVDLAVEITMDTGAGLITEEATYTNSNVAPGAEGDPSAGIIHILSDPYDSHEVTRARVKACWSDGTCSEWESAPI